MGGGAPEVVVPDAEHCEEHGEVLAEGVEAEVLVHCVRAEQKLEEVVHSDVEGDGEANGAPQRVAPADPVPELEHVLGVDAERCDFLCGRRHRHKVLGHSVLAEVCLLEEPLPRRRSVRNGLQRRERFAHNHKQRRMRVQSAHRLVDVRPVHIRHEMRAD